MVIRLFLANHLLKLAKIDWKKTLNIRPEANISKEAEDILRKLINDPETRLGANAADEIKSHPFFKGIDWNHIKETLEPPFVPELKNNYDTKYFDEFEEDESFYPINNDNSKGKKYQKKDMCFVDFTYNRENDNNYRNNMVTAIEVFDSLQENIKKIKEGQFDTNTININSNNKNVKNSGSKNSIKSNGNEKNGNGNKNSSILANFIFFTFSRYLPCKKSGPFQAGKNYAIKNK